MATFDDLATSAAALAAAKTAADTITVDVIDKVNQALALCSAEYAAQAAANTAVDNAFAAAEVATGLDVAKAQQAAAIATYEAELVTFQSYANELLQLIPE